MEALPSYVVFDFANQNGFEILVDNNSKEQILSSGNSIDITQKLLAFAKAIEQEATRRTRNDTYKAAVKVCLALSEKGESSGKPDLAYKCAVEVDSLLRSSQKPVKTTKKKDNGPMNWMLSPFIQGFSVPIPNVTIAPHTGNNFWAPTWAPEPSAEQND